MKAQGGSRCIALLSLTLALDGNGWSTPCPGCFTLGKDPVPIVYEAGWEPGPAWKSPENLPPNRIQSPGCQTVVSHYTTYAIPAHSYVVLNTKKMINSNNINNMKILVIKIFMLFMPSKNIHAIYA